MLTTPEFPPRRLCGPGLRSTQAAANQICRGRTEVAAGGGSRLSPLQARAGWRCWHWLSAEDRIGIPRGSNRLGDHLFGVISNKLQLLALRDGSLGGTAGGVVRRIIQRHRPQLSLSNSRALGLVRHGTVRLLSVMPANEPLLLMRGEVGGYPTFVGWPLPSPATTDRCRLKIPRSIVWFLRFRRHGRSAVN